VGELQAFLIAENKGPEAERLTQVGPTDFFGLFTENALSEFQLAAHIHPARGFFGPITRAYMDGL